MTFSPDGKRGYLASADRLIHAFDLPGETKSAKFGGHADEVWALAMTPDGSHFLSGGKDGRVMLWDARPDAARSVPVTAAMARPLFFPDGRRALLRPFDGPAQVLDLATLDLTPALSGGFVAAISPASELVVLDTPGQRLSFRSSADGKVSSELSFEGQPVRTAASSGGRWLVLITRSGPLTSAVRVDLATGKADPPRELPESGFRLAAVSDDGRLFAYAEGPVLHLHDLADGNSPAKVFRNRFYQFKDLAFSPDGSRLAAANQDGRVRVFRSADLALLHDFRGHHFDSGSVGFSADGGTLISLGTREGLRFWRLDRGHEAGHIRVPECRDYLSLSPDGKHLLVMTRSGVSVLRAE
jgi:WD40 repeat protein